MSQTEVQLIKDAVIVNADISNSAAIDVSKISGAMPTAGGTFTNDVTFDGATAGRDILFDRSNNFLKFNDNAKISLGTNDEANLYYDGFNPILYAGTNTLRIVADNIHLEAGDFGDEFLRCNHDGAVELYNDNSKKFQTYSSGIQFFGNIKNETDGTNQGMFLGAANDFQFYHDGNRSAVNNRTGDLRLLGSGNIILGRADSGNTTAYDEQYISCTSNGAVELYYNGTKELETTADGISVSSDNAVVNIVSNATSTSTSFIQFRGYRIVADVGRLGELQFINQRDGDVQAEIEVIANGDTNSYFDFKTNNAGLRTFRVQHDGTHIPDGLFAKFGNSNDMQMGHNTFNYITYTGASLQITGDSTNDILLRPRSNETAAVFEPNGAVELYFDNTKRLETLTDGAQCKGVMHVMSQDGNVIQHTESFYLVIATNSSNTITLTGLIGSGRFVIGGYANAGQGAIAFNAFFGGAMFATQHYNVNVLQNSAMQNTAISTSKNNTSYVITITNNSSSSTLALSGFLESTGSQMSFAFS